MNRAAEKSAEINKNLARFLQMLPSMVADHEGQYALFRHGEIVEFFPSAIDAQIAGNRRFDDSIFSIQHVKATAEELGYFSCAINNRQT